MIPVVIIGCAGHARVVVDAVRSAYVHEVVGFLADNEQTGVMPFGGIPVLGPIKAFPVRGVKAYFVAIGDIGARERITMLLTGDDARFVNVIHPTAQVSSTAIMSEKGGIFVGAGARIGPNCYIGNGTIVNTHASLDHDSNLGLYSHLCPGATTGGHVTIGHRTLIGIGACIRDHISIGSESIIGMGSVVLKSVPANSVAYGNPCKLARTL